MFGRLKELQFLNSDYHTNKSSFIVCYGRRRIGKSYLINQHLKSKNYFHFEGIEGQSLQYQLNSFTSKVFEEFKIENTKIKSINNWEKALELLAKQIPSSKKRKFVIFLDEFQWIAAGRSQFPAILKKVWDNLLLNKNVQLILCGSVSSYMIGKVIKSKALYGRIDSELKIDFLSTRESCLFFSKNKSDNEIIKYLMTLGGVPKYLADLKSSQSYEENICNIFFSNTSSYINEFEKVFYSQFSEHNVYEKIVSFLASGPQKMEDISKHIKMKSGGGLKSYLENLEKAQFIKSYFSNPNNIKSKIIHYRLTDPFLRFYFTFVYPNRNLILDSRNPLQTTKNLLSKKLDSYLGIAFENYCLINSMEIAEMLGIADKVTSYGPLNIKKKAQIDLLFFRNDQTINMVEIKFQKEEVEPSIIVEIEKKLETLKELFPEYSIQKSLVTLSPLSKKLQTSEYFDQVLTVKKWLKR